MLPTSLTGFFVLAQVESDSGAQHELARRNTTCPAQSSCVLVLAELQKKEALHVSQLSIFCQSELGLFALRQGRMHSTRLCCTGLTSWQADVQHVPDSARLSSDGGYYWHIDATTIQQIQILDSVEFSPYPPEVCHPRSTPPMHQLSKWIAPRLCLTTAIWSRRCWFVFPRADWMPRTFMTRTARCINCGCQRTRIPRSVRFWGTDLDCFQDSHALKTDAKNWSVWHSFLCHYPIMHRS